VKCTSIIRADFEGGRIKHVPSTGDMLALALPEAGRRAASDLGGALGAGLSSDYDTQISSPRSNASSDEQARPFPRRPAAASLLNIWIDSPNILPSNLETDSLAAANYK